MLVCIDHDHTLDYACVVFVVITLFDLASRVGFLFSPGKLLLAKLTYKENICSQIRLNWQCFPLSTLTGKLFCSFTKRRTTKEKQCKQPRILFLPLNRNVWVYVNAVLRVWAQRRFRTLHTENKYKYVPELDTKNKMPMLFIQRNNVKSAYFILMLYAAYSLQSSVKHKPGTQYITMP